ncbi:uncharacterized protein LOC103522520, partial [Diaphorina citri]|uniref:Uncharacterized protein LOC103522520 n=1 Tax=Diaphorina citri TaxID=121845 RepID=A0A1S3DQ67_DIACI
TNKKMKKNLLLKTKLVKSAVLNLTSNSEDGIETPQGRLRKSAFKPNELVTNKKMKKNLLLKTKLVKSAVLNLTSNSEDGIETPQGRLRKSAFKPNSPLVVAHRANRRKVSLDSVRSSVSESNVKSPLRPVIAESVIFRRHSSDSSCSSEEEEGEERRTSKDEEAVSE